MPHSHFTTPHHYPPYLCTLESVWVLPDDVEATIGQGACEVDEGAVTHHTRVGGGQVSRHTIGVLDLSTQVEW